MILEYAVLALVLFAGGFLGVSLAAIEWVSASRNAGYALAIFGVALAAIALILFVVSH